MILSCQPLVLPTTGTMASIARILGLITYLAATVSLTCEAAAYT